MISYDPHHWRDTIFAIRGSMVKVISFRTALITAMATGLTVLHQELFEISTPSTTLIHTFIGTALSLLLVFRTNASYDRFWEGRKLWGQMVNTCRNLARSVSIHLAAHPDRVEKVLKLCAAFPDASKSALRHSSWDSKTVDLDDATAIGARLHAPTAILQRITWHLEQERRAGTVDSIVFDVMDRNNTILLDVIGGCERIHKTPLPFSYVVHLRRALVLYCVTLPFAMLAIFHWWTIPVTFAITYVLLGIEEIGVEIEDPFEGDDNDLPLEDIANTIRKNVETYLPTPAAEKP